MKFFGLLGVLLVVVSVKVIELKIKILILSKIKTKKISVRRRWGIR